MENDLEIENLIKNISNIKLNKEDNNSSAIIIQKNIRRFLNHKKLTFKKDNMSIEIVEILLDNYIKTFDLIKNINKSLSKKKIRNQNFPSEISENIVKFVLCKKYKVMPSWDTNEGDLTILNKKIEVKGFMSTGPLSFGPSENWSLLYFVNAIDFQKKNFKIYEIKLSNNDTLWSNIKINKNESYKDQCNQGRRPRLSFDILQKQMKDYCKLIFDGNIKDLY